MKETAINILRLMPREELERFAIRAATQVHSDRNEIEAGNVFIAILIGFLLGAIVAASGFILGLGLA